MLGNRSPQGGSSSSFKPQYEPAHPHASIFPFIEEDELTDSDAATFSLIFSAHINKPGDQCTEMDGSV